MTSREGSLSHISDVIASNSDLARSLKRCSTKKTPLRVEDLPVKDDLPERKYLKAALHDRIKGSMTQREFMATLLNWSYEYAFEGYMPALAPYKPFEVTKLDALTKEEYKATNPETIRKFKDKKMEWKDKVHAVKHKNESNLMWLKKMLGYFKYKGDTVKIIDVTNRIKLFKGE